jgi:hypothetical protein
MKDTTIVEVRVPTTTLRFCGETLQQLCVVETETGSRHAWINVPRVEADEQAIKKQKLRGAK